MKKSQIKLIVTITLLLASFFVVMEVIRDKALGDADIKTKENACSVANRLVKNLDVSQVKDASLRACAPINLEIPQKGYKLTKDGIMKNIADKTAKTWEIWNEGRFEDNLGESWLPGPQNCFIQYTFTIKDLKETKNMEISDSRLLEFLFNTPYKIDDTSDRCAGSKGGHCRENNCLENENKVPSSKQCFGDKNICCLPKKSCLARGGRCGDQPKPGEKQYSNPLWNCGRGEVCFVSENNFNTYAKFIAANSGKITIDGKFYPQNYQGNKAVTYAIVFISRTTSLKELIGFETDTNSNGILIAPLNDVKDKCNVQIGTWA